MKPIKHNFELVGLHRHKRVDLRIAQLGGCTSGITNSGHRVRKIPALVAQLAHGNAGGVFDSQFFAGLQQHTIKIPQQCAETLGQRPLGVMQNLR
jgi:hypothetical protein